MSFRAMSLASTEHESQNEIARQVEAELIIALGLHERLDAIADQHVPAVLPYTNGDEKKARKAARQWTYECLCMYVYHHLNGGDIVFLE